MPGSRRDSPYGERYLRYLKGSEEMLEKLKREAQENVSSGASSSGRGGSLDAARFSRKEPPFPPAVELLKVLEERRR